MEIIKIALTGFYDPENLGIDTKIKILHESRYWQKRFLGGGHFEIQDYPWK